MNLTDLGYFLAVARSGNFSKAARLAHVSPAAISKAIQRLEHDLGTPLLVRTTRTVSLTEAGHLLLDRGTQIARDVEDARHAMGQLGDTLRGPLRVAAMEVFSVEVVPRALAMLVREGPELKPELYEMLPQEMTEHLTAGNLDVGFTIGGQATRTVQCETLGRSRGALICGHGHPLFERGRVSKKQLHAHPFVVPRFWGQPELPCLDQFDDERYPRTIGATIELLQSAIGLALSGEYLLYVPEVSVRRHLQSGELKALTGLRGLPAFELNMLTRRTPFAKRAAVRLGEVVKTLVRQTAI